MRTKTAGGHVADAFRRWISSRGLRAVNRIGSGARLQGRADFGGGGDITIGDRFVLLSQPVRSHIFATPGARVAIGDCVEISYGAAISAQLTIEIGNNTTFGSYVVIIDNDFHRVGDRNEVGESAPIRIGSNVKVGARVTILRGSTIGDDVCIMSGSMVSGTIPSGTTVGGVPARPVANGSTVAASGNMAGLVQNVLGLDRPPHSDEGPTQIAAWDSLGSLRLLLAIEDTYGVSLKEDEMRMANTVAALSAIIDAKLSSLVPTR